MGLCSSCLPFKQRRHSAAAMKMVHSDPGEHFGVWLAAAAQGVGACSTHCSCEWGNSFSALGWLFGSLQSQHNSAVLLEILTLAVA